MERLLRLCIFSIALIGFSLQANSFVNRAYAEDLTPQQRLDVVLEGINRTPQQLSDICYEHGISEDTYREWKEELIASADKIYGLTDRGMFIRDQEEAPIKPRTKVIDLGRDVFTEEAADTAGEKWRVHTSFKLWAARLTQDEFPDYDATFRDWTLLGGPAFSFSKGKNAISFSAIMPLNNWDSRDDILEDGLVQDVSLDYWLADVRYHRSVNKNLSWFLGYKVQFNDWKARRHDISDGSLDFEVDSTAIQHGPVLGTNASLPIKKEGLPISGYFSFAYGPAQLLHENSHEDFLFGMPAADGVKSDTELAWYISSEMGIRIDTSNRTAFNLGWRGDYWGFYQSSDVISVTGPSATFSYSW